MSDPTKLRIAPGSGGQRILRLGPDRGRTLETGEGEDRQHDADQNALPKKFLDAILTDLRNAGLLLSKKGRNGGYMLAKRPEDISMGAIIRALDGPLAPISCASRTSYAPCVDCGPIEECEIRLAMLDVREAIANVLDHRTLAELRDARGDLMASVVYRI